VKAAKVVVAECAAKEVPAVLVVKADRVVAADAVKVAVPEVLAAAQAARAAASVSISAKRKFASSARKRWT
jgi:hypothetical protein